MVTLRYLLLPTLFLLSLLPLTAQQPFLVEQSRMSAIDYYATNYGVFGLNVAQSTAGLIYPRGSGINYIFGSGLWFGAKKDRFDPASGNTYRVPLCFITYNPNSGVSWARSGDARYVTDTNYPLSDIFNELDYDTAGVSTANPTDPRWPLWIRPGRPVTALNPGKFEPYDSYRTTAFGEYPGPAFLEGVDEQMTARFHDGETALYERMTQARMDSLGYPIGMQVQQNIYSWSSGPMATTVIVQYQIVSTTSDTLFDCIAAPMGDADLGGDAGNDRGSFYSDRPELRSILMSSQNEPGKTIYPLVCTVLEAPVLDDDGVADDTRRGVYRNSGRLGTAQVWTITEDPTTPEDRYAFMSSGQFDESETTMDIRYLAASRPFTLRPYDTAHFAVAYIILDPAVVGGTRKEGDDRSPASVPNPQLETAVERALAWYYASDPSSGVRRATAGASTLAIHPNPASDRAVLRVELAERTHLRLEVIDNIGRTLLSHDLGVRDRGTVAEELDITSLPAGRYTVAVTGGEARTAVPLVVTR